MKLSQRTLKILKNYSLINGNINLEAGNQLRITDRSILSWCTIDETIPSEFPIYELGRFLDSLSLFKDPDLEFQNDKVIIKESDNPATNMIYYAAMKDGMLLNTVPYKEMTAESIVEFPFKESYFSVIQKAASTLKTNDLAIIGDGKHISIKIGEKIYEKKQGAKNVFTQTLCETDKVFEVYLNIDKLKLLHKDYRLLITNKKGSIVLQFINDEDGKYLSYGIVSLAYSKMGE